MLKKWSAVPPGSSGSCSNALSKPAFLIFFVKTSLRENLTVVISDSGHCYTAIHGMGNSRKHLVTRAQNWLLVGPEALGHGTLVVTGTHSSGHSKPRDVLILPSVRLVQRPGSWWQKSSLLGYSRNVTRSQDEKSDLQKYLGETNMFGHTEQSWNLTQHRAEPHLTSVSKSLQKFSFIWF